MTAEKKEKYHPAQQSQAHTERLTLFSTPQTSCYRLSLKESFLISRKIILMFNFESINFTLLNFLYEKGKDPDL
jgi:hypothetical protein